MIRILTILTLSIGFPFMLIAQDCKLLSIEDFVAQDGLISTLYLKDHDLLMLSRENTSSVIIIIENKIVKYYNINSKSFTEVGPAIHSQDGKIDPRILMLFTEAMPIEILPIFLGKPDRDVASGGSILQWDLSDGSIVEVNVSLLNAVGVHMLDQSCVRILKNGERKALVLANAGQSNISK